MSEKEKIENPQAFPVAIPGDEKKGWLPEHVEGMTLRDYFAGQLITGAYNSINRGYEQGLSRKAYLLADAMLKERMKALE